jgi:NADH-quinone oxidoreductase subunit H
MAGWGSNSKYALFGAVRSVAQIVSYEIPAGLAILSVVALYGTLNLNEIALQQSGFATEPLWLFGWDVQPVGSILGWSVVRYPHLLVVWCVFFIATLAETNRAPFDLPEAESELVAGFLTEYSGFRFAVLMLAEYAYMLLVALLGVVLFFGGWASPLPNLAWANLPANPTTWDLWYTGHWALATSVGLWAPFWLMIKASVWILLMMWVRWTLPRLRPDQLMGLCWKVLTPLALGLFLVSVVWKLIERSLTL